MRGPIIQKLRRRGKAFLAAAMVLAAVLASPRTGCAETAAVVVDPGRSFGRWEGWGTSLCWWAKAFGDRDDLADVFFTTRTVSFGGQTLPGLGLTIVRYNAGACSRSEVDGHAMVVSPRFPPSRQMDGFWLDGRSADPRSLSWDWSADANQRAMLLKARDRGADHFELFSNSPMWWMCANGNPSGDARGGDNLPPANYAAFATYLATVAREAKDRWGVAFTSVEPLNEPNAKWWKADHNQEGCHFSREAQAAVVQRLRAELDRLGLRDTPVAASDENTYDEALETWNRFGPEARAAVSKINVHGYQKAKGRRDLLFAAAGGKTLWNSEYGENDATGLFMASNLLLDFRDLHPTAWVYWQVLDGGGWGLLNSNIASKFIGPANAKYYVLAQYSRHIRPGMTILGTDDPDSVAAYDPAARKLVVVTFNRGADGEKTFDLAKFASVGGPATRWLTTPRGAARYEVQRNLPVDSKRITVALPAASVLTLEVENVASP